MDQFELLTKTLYFEAGFCSITELAFVGWVIRNRVEGPRWYGNTYPQVCLKKWQFSCWNQKTVKEIEAIKWGDDKANFRWKVCRFIAAYILEAPKKDMPKELEKVYHYYNPILVCPSWAKKMTRTYPREKLAHIFLRAK